MNTNEKENILKLLSQLKESVAFETECERYLDFEFDAIINVVKNVSTNETYLEEIERQKKEITGLHKLCDKMEDYLIFG